MQVEERAHGLAAGGSQALVMTHFSKYHRN